MKLKKLVSAISISILIAIMSTVSVFAAPGKTFTAKKAAAEPTIDGKLNESIWSGEFSSCGETKPFQYKYLWDDKNFYFAVKAPDTKLFSNEKKTFLSDKNSDTTALNAWDYDNVQLFFSPTNSQQIMTGNDVQLVITYQSDGKPAVRVGAAEAGCKQKDNLVSGVYNNIKASCTNNSEEWILEVAIPWSTFKITDFTKQFGIDIAVCNSDLSTKDDPDYKKVGGTAWNSFEGSDVLTLSNEVYPASQTNGEATVAPSQEVSGSPSTSASASASNKTSASPAGSQSTSVSPTTKTTSQSSTPGKNSGNGTVTALVIAGIIVIAGAAGALIYFKKFKK